MINKFPKSTKEAIRYIKQDVIREQLEEIRKLVIRYQRRNITLE